MLMAAVTEGHRPVVTWFDTRAAVCALPDMRGLRLMAIAVYARQAAYEIKVCWVSGYFFHSFFLQAQEPPES